ncbi:MAG: nucleotide exchange factor GrpE [Spirochaetales bacterium]|nr:nucleotide exchange factor GrpE [Spirochaetales bacterium]
MKKKNKNKKKGSEYMAEEKTEEKIEVPEEETKETETSQVVEEVTAEEVETEDPKDAKIAELEAKIKEMEETISKMKDDELRRMADTENYKKRLRTEKENAVKYANESLISDLLEPLDNFTRAIESASQSQDFEAMKTGVVMVNDQLLQRLKTNWGLEMINSAVGTPFDPNTMEAYGVQEKEGITEEEVGMECNKGWLLHGKVLRTAKVFVAKPKK